MLPLKNLDPFLLLFITKILVGPLPHINKPLITKLKPSFSFFFCGKKIYSFKNSNQINQLYNLIEKKRIYLTYHYYLIPLQYSKSIVRNLSQRVLFYFIFFYLSFVSYSTQGELLIISIGASNNHKFTAETEKSSAKTVSRLR